MLGGVATAPVHPAVLMLMTPAPNVTVAEGHATLELLTNMFCACDTPNARHVNANTAVTNLRVRENSFMNFL